MCLNNTTMNLILNKSYLYVEYIPAREHTAIIAYIYIYMFYLLPNDGDVCVALWVWEKCYFILTVHLYMDRLIKTPLEP